MRIVFMGTPEFAVASLQKLHESELEIAAVVTAPDKPAGRGRKLQASAVKEYAQLQDLPVLQPTNLKSAAFQEALREFGAQVFVVVAFRMLPHTLWSIPPKGTFNLHASLLPHYRGAAPINWAIINGETETGLTTFLIDREIDTGKLLLQERVPLPEDFDAGQLHDVLKERGAALVLETCRGLRDGSLNPQPQPTGGEFKAAPKLFTADCQVNWQQPAKTVYNFIRGLSPYPLAWSTLDGKRMKFYKPLGYANRGELLPGARPGSFDLRQGGELWVKAGEGIVRLNHLKMEGKKRMPAEELFRGYTPEEKQFSTT